MLKLYGFFFFLVLAWEKKEEAKNDHSILQNPPPPLHAKIGQKVWDENESCQVFIFIMVEPGCFFRIKARSE